MRCGIKERKSCQLRTRMIYFYSSFCFVASLSSWLQERRTHQLSNQVHSDLWSSVASLCSLPTFILDSLLLFQTRGRWGWVNGHLVWFPRYYPDSDPLMLLLFWCLSILWWCSHCLLSCSHAMLSCVNGRHAIEFFGWWWHGHARRAIKDAPSRHSLSFFLPNRIQRFIIIFNPFSLNRESHSNSASCSHKVSKKITRKIDLHVLFHPLIRLLNWYSISISRSWSVVFNFRSNPLE